MRSIRIVASLITIFTLANCGGLGESASSAVGQLSSPSSFGISGAGTSQVGGNTYIFATSNGTIDNSNNSVVASFADSYVPLYLGSTGLYWDQMSSGSCTSLSTMVPAVGGGSGNLVTSQVSATGCTDQSQINVYLDTTQIYDSQGFSGTDVISLAAIVDNAPKVSTTATGNSAPDGSGSTESNPGVFSISGDQSLVVTFSKSLTSGTLTGTLTGCSATLGTPILATNNQTVIWPLANFSTFTTGTTCTLNVGQVTDGVGNPEDPSDVNLNMTITFQ